MKKMIFTLIAIGMVTMSSMSMAAMSINKVRKETRFLTDKMAYELNLTSEQYDDTYEINYDFIYSVRDIMDDVVDGYDYALDEYYNALDVRNDDLHWVMADWQYERFLDTEYFYRPIYSDGSSWSFRVYITYTNPFMFYFDRPPQYNTYSGGHYRTHYNNISYYSNRYKHDVYKGTFQTRNANVYINNRRSDFGITTPRSGSSTNNNRSSSPRISNDDLYNTGRSSGSSVRAGSASGVSRPANNTNNQSSGRSSSSNRTENSTSGSTRTGNATGSSTYTRPSSSSRTDNNTGSSTRNGNTGSSTYARPSSSSRTDNNTGSSTRTSTETRSPASTERTSTNNSQPSAPSVRSNSAPRSSASERGQKENSSSRSSSGTSTRSNDKPRR